jgi:release factor glutamine methyltransferase
VAGTWRDRYDSARAELGSDLEARRLVEHASGYEGAEFHLGLDQKVSERAGPYFDQLVARRRAGEPLQYVMGRWGFRSLDLMVDRRVLIPRPETEQVVEIALAEMRRLGKRHPVAVDLGTGSGAIAIALAVEGGASEVWATDVSPDAVDVARANLTGAGTLVATRVRVVAGSWFSALPEDLRGRVDLIVSNPPYVSEAEMADLPAEVRDWEPHGALAAGPEGLDDIEAIVAEAPAWLADDGVLVVEIAPHQASPVEERGRAAGFASVEIGSDLAGRPRALVARRTA